MVACSLCVAWALYLLLFTHLSAILPIPATTFTHIPRWRHTTPTFTATRTSAAVTNSAQRGVTFTHAHTHSDPRNEPHSSSW